MRKSENYMSGDQVVHKSTSPQFHLSTENVATLLKSGDGIQFQLKSRSAHRHDAIQLFPMVTWAWDFFSDILFYTLRILSYTNVFHRPAKWLLTKGSIRNQLQTWEEYNLIMINYIQNRMWKASCILVRNFEGLLEIGRHEGGVGGSGFLSFFLLLSWNNCCMISAHSDANIPRRIFTFGWKGWTGAAGLSVGSKPFCPSSPLGKSLQMLITGPCQLYIYFGIWNKCHSSLLSGK